MDITAVRHALATAADVIEGLLCYDHAPSSVEVPGFYVGRVEIDWDSAMGRGMDSLVIYCRVLTSRADDRAGQDSLNAYLKGSGSTSLKAALQADRTLGGACSTMRVRSVDGYRMFEHAGTEYFGAELAIDVHGRGD